MTFPRLTVEVHPHITMIKRETPTPNSRNFDALARPDYARRGLFSWCRCCNGQKSGRWCKINTRTSLTISSPPLRLACNRWPKKNSSPSDSLPDLSKSNQRVSSDDREQITSLPSLMKISFPLLSSFEFREDGSLLDLWSVPHITTYGSARMIQQHHIVPPTY